LIGEAVSSATVPVLESKPVVGSVILPFSNVISLIRVDPVTVKLVELVPVPPKGVVTLTGPVLAPIGTLTVMLLSLFTVKLVVLVVLKVTEFAPVKLLPEIVTGVPIAPCVGEKLETIGGGGNVPVTVKPAELTPVPLGLVTAMRPLLADVGTTAVICVLESTVKLALVPLNLTETAPLNPVPLITTDVPAGPLVGANEVIVGTLPALGTIKLWT